METYQPQDAQEIQDVVKRIFAPIFEAALKGEMQNHLGYANHGAVNARQARERFEQFQKDWASDLGAVAIWQNNFTHVEQLFSYGSAVRKAMYTTNAIESVNSSFRNVTKKGSFSNEDAVFKLLYLRVQELYYESPRSQARRAQTDWVTFIKGGAQCPQGGRLCV